MRGVCDGRDGLDERFDVDLANIFDSVGGIFWWFDGSLRWKRSICIYGFVLNGYILFITCCTLCT